MGHELRHATRHGNRHGRRRAKLESINARLQDLDGLPKARGAKRSRLIEAALKLPFAKHIEPDLEGLAADERRKQQKAAARHFRSNRKQGPFSTEAALAGGRAHPYKGIGANTPEGLLGIIAGHKAAALDFAALAARPLLRLEDCAILDARVLRLIWAKNRVSLTTLIWASGIEDAIQFVLVMDLGEPSAPAAGICRLSSEGPQFQSLTVEQASAYKPGNWVFVCPILGTRHALVYLRDGIFASAKAQRLVHASQRK